MDSLYTRFKRVLSHRRLPAPGGDLFCAFSGGKDSTLLLSLLHRLRRELDFRLSAVYLNHMIRRDHLREETWVKTFCKTRKITLVHHREPVRKEASVHRMNLEECASRARYRFFHRLLRDNPSASLATGHTASDALETLLIKLMRGSGTEGLAGIFLRRDRIIRPLLEFDQDEVLEYLDHFQIPWYHDPSNRDRRFLRNRIRREFLPRLRGMSPGLDHRAVSACLILQEELEYFQDRARRWLRHHLLLGAILPLPALHKTHSALKRHIAREYIRRIKGDLRSVDRRHIRALTGDGEMTLLSLPDLQLIRRKGFLFPRDLVISDYRETFTRLAFPAAVHLAPADLSFTLRISQKFRKPRDNHHIVVPMAALRFPLSLRSPRTGDRYRKLNAPFVQTVKEMIREQGFPSELRNLCPVLENGNGDLIWCCGSPVAHSYRVTDGSSPPYLSVTCTPRSSGSEDLKDQSTPYRRR